jgi:hypothetical protein
MSERGKGNRLAERAPAVADRPLPAQAPPVSDQPGMLCWSRWLGAVPAAGPGTAVAGAVRAHGPDGAGICSSNGPTWEASPSSLLVSSQARISPLSGSGARWSLSQPRLPRAPCASASHSPAPRTPQPGRVDHHVHWPARLGPRQRRGERQPRAAPRERGVVRDADAQAEQGCNGAGQAFGLL